MSTHLQFMIVGLGAGAVYAALAQGLVVTHKGAGTINFAQGAVAMYGAYVFDEVRSTGDLVLPVGRLGVGENLWLALALGVASAGALGLAAHALVFRPLRLAPPLAKVVASVGLMVVVQAVVVLRFSADARSVSPVLPNEVVHLGGATAPRDRLYLALIVVAMAVVLWAFFRFTRHGLATRAAAENEMAVALAGYSPDRLAAGTWLLASALPALVVILAAPSTGLNPTTTTLYVVPALAVALVGRFASLGVACAAGLVLGVVQAEISLLVSRSWWPEWATVGVADAVPFLVVVVALVVLGRSIPERGASEAAELPPVPRAGRLTVSRAGLVVAAGVVALVGTDGSYRFGVITSMVFALLALSLVVVTGLVGQISLAQAAFAGAAGFTLSQLDLPFPLSVVVAATVSTLLGVVVGLPALRIRGAQLAVVTLAGAVAIERFVFRNPSFTSPDGNPIARPELFGVDLSVRGDGTGIRLEFGLLVLTVLLLACLGVRNLVRSDTGRAFLAVRRNERAAASGGVHVAATKLLAFGIASFLAGVGGCLVGFSRGQLSADSFGALAGLSLLTVAYLGGITSIGGALWAGLFAPLGIGYVLVDRHLDLGEHYLLATGLALVASAVLNPSGIATKRRRPAPAASRRRPTPALAEA